jgi:hypothetical protein
MLGWVAGEAVGGKRRVERRGLKRPGSGGRERRFADLTGDLTFAFSLTFLMIA